MPSLTGFKGKIYPAELLPLSPWNKHHLC